MTPTDQINMLRDALEKIAVRMPDSIMSRIATDTLAATSSPPIARESVESYKFKELLESYHAQPQNSEEEEAAEKLLIAHINAWHAAHIAANKPAEPTETIIEDDEFCRLLDAVRHTNWSSASLIALNEYIGKWSCKPAAASQDAQPVADRPNAVMAAALPPELANAFVTLESNGGEGRTIVLKFNQRDDAHAVHDFLLKGGGRDYRTAASGAGGQKDGAA